MPVPTDIANALAKVLERAEREHPPTYRWTKHTTAEARAADREEYFASVIAALYAERDNARANARILAHSYTHDSRPPRRVVDESLAYPVDPARNDRERAGTITVWNATTWWGGIAVDGAAVPSDWLEFHGTSVRGQALGGRQPAVGDRVTVIFSDTKCERLLSVEIQVKP